MNLIEKFFYFEQSLNLSFKEIGEIFDKSENWARVTYYRAKCTLAERMNVDMKCNIIKDLLPSYIDCLCSEETAFEVETHIERCAQCNKTMQMMEQPTQHIVEPKFEEAKEPFKRINKKRRFQVIAASLLTFLIMIISYQVVENVGVVNQFFFPWSTE